MSRPVRIVMPRDVEADHDVLSDQAAWGEQPPSYVPGEILIADRSKAAEILREARRRGKTFVRRKSALVAVGAAVVGVSSALGATAWLATLEKRKKKSPAARLGDFIAKAKD